MTEIVVARKWDCTICNNQVILNPNTCEITCKCGTIKHTSIIIKPNTWWLEESRQPRKHITPLNER